MKPSIEILPYHIRTRISLYVYVRGAEDSVFDLPGHAQRLAEVVLELTSSRDMAGNGRKVGFRPFMKRSDQVSKI